MSLRVVCPYYKYICLYIYFLPSCIYSFVYVCFYIYPFIYIIVNVSITFFYINVSITFFVYIFLMYIDLYIYPLVYMYLACIYF